MYERYIFQEAIFLMIPESLVRAPGIKKYSAVSFFPNPPFFWHPEGPFFQHFDGDSKSSDHGSGYLSRAFLSFAADCGDVLGLWGPRPYGHWDPGLMV